MAPVLLLDGRADIVGLGNSGQEQSPGLGVLGSAPTHLPESHYVAQAGWGLKILLPLPAGAGMADAPSRLACVFKESSHLLAGQPLHMAGSTVDCQKRVYGFGYHFAFSGVLMSSPGVYLCPSTREHLCPACWCNVSSHHVCWSL